MFSITVCNIAIGQGLLGSNIHQGVVFQVLCITTLLASKRLGQLQLPCPSCPELMQILVTYIRWLRGLNIVVMEEREGNGG